MKNDESFNFQLYTLAIRACQCHLSVFTKTFCCFFELKQFTVTLIMWTFFKADMLNARYNLGTLKCEHTF